VFGLGFRCRFGVRFGGRGHLFVVAGRSRRGQDQRCGLRLGQHLVIRLSQRFGGGRRFHPSGAAHQTVGHDDRHAADDEEPQECRGPEGGLVDADRSEVAQLPATGVAQQGHHPGGQH
jgi:hypothetical protein